MFRFVTFPWLEGQREQPSPSSKPPGDVRTADLELAARCRAGDAGAFEELYRQHARRLFNLVVRMIGSVDDAEDLLQEVFLQAHRKLSGFRGDSALGTWLYRLTMNHCLDHLRGRQARMNRATESLDDEGSDEPMAPAPAVPAPVSRLDLERAIEMLPDGARAAFLLHDVEGFEHREIAQILGISEGTSKSQVHKARMKLRAFLSR
jgi:RNA polymerase sigma-70 factor (ECF subfamily)